MALERYHAHSRGEIESRPLNIEKQLQPRFAQAGGFDKQMDRPDPLDCDEVIRGRFEYGPAFLPVEAFPLGQADSDYDLLLWFEAPIAEVESRYGCEDSFAGPFDPAAGGEGETLCACLLG
jgi:hypothetical protein